LVISYWSLIIGHWSLIIEPCFQWQLMLQPLNGITAAGTAPDSRHRMRITGFPVRHIAPVTLMQNYNNSQQ